MIQVTFAYLMPEEPALGTGFYLDGQYAGYIGRSRQGQHYVYFTPIYWAKTRLREARGYVVVSGTDSALSLVRRLVARLAYRQLIHCARAAIRADSLTVWYRRILRDLNLQRTLAKPYIDQHTWNDPSLPRRSRDYAFTPECASQKAVGPALFTKRVFHVYPALSYNLIHYTDGSTRRVTAQDIQAGAEPRPADSAFPLVRVACPVSPTPQATTPARTLFLPMTVPPHRLAARHPAAPTTTRNTQ